MGERQPVTQCEGQKATPALVACLQPNRRVDIEVAGDR
jgi:outer membrane protein OmpA-like peptidoglycan-associated protein